MGLHRTVFFLALFAIGLFLLSLWWKGGGWPRSDDGESGGKESPLEKAIAECTVACVLAQAKSSGTVRELGWCKLAFNATELGIECSGAVCHCQDLVDDVIIPPCVLPHFNQKEYCQIDCVKNLCD